MFQNITLSENEEIMMKNQKHGSILSQNQACSKEEYESGYCLDCDQIEFFDDFEEEN